MGQDLLLFPHPSPMDWDLTDYQSLIELFSLDIKVNFIHLIQADNNRSGSITYTEVEQCTLLCNLL
jgi:hypothetical protein